MSWEDMDCLDVVGGMHVWVPWPRRESPPLEDNRVGPAQRKESDESSSLSLAAVHLKRYCAGRPGMDHGNPKIYCSRRRTTSTGWVFIGLYESFGPNESLSSTMSLTGVCLYT